jgi:hypothetical protein
MAAPSNVSGSAHFEADDPTFRPLPTAVYEIVHRPSVKHFTL